MEKKMDKKLKDRIKEIKEIVQLDFEHDNELFIDPYRIDEKRSELLKRAKEKILKYFDLFFYSVEHNLRNNAAMLGEHLHEINATKLGYTNRVGKPKGKGFCRRDLLVIFDEAIKIKNYIEDMPDILILAENVGPDKVSDLTTNIIYEELLEFTIEIISKYNLDIAFIPKRKWIFDVNIQGWYKKELAVPCIDDDEILFIPDKLVASYEIFSYENVYNQLVYPFYKVNTSIHRLIRLLKNNEERPDCKRIKEKYPMKRETVREFKQNYADRYNEYKKEILKDYWRQ